MNFIVVLNKYGGFSMLNMDWVDSFFQKMSLKVYEDEQEKRRQTLQNEKKQIIKKNRIIVRVNNEIIYDSKKNKDISDELYFALLSYGLREAVSKKEKKRNPLISYELNSKISSIPRLTM